MTLYDRNGNPTPALANSEAFRTNWDRIFGKTTKCPHCSEGNLKVTATSFPPGDSREYLICDHCDGTYPMPE